MNFSNAVSKWNCERLQSTETFILAVIVTLILWCYMNICYAMLNDYILYHHDVLWWRIIRNNSQYFNKQMLLDLLIAYSGHFFFISIQASERESKQFLIVAVYRKKILHLLFSKNLPQIHVHFYLNYNFIIM